MKNAKRKMKNDDEDDKMIQSVGDFSAPWFASCLCLRVSLQT